MALPSSQAAVEKSLGRNVREGTEMKRFLGILTLCVLVGSLLGCSPSPSENPIPTEMTKSCVGRAITVGDISDNPDEVITGVLPLANYLASRLGDFGYKCGNVIVPDT